MWQGEGGHRCIYNLVRWAVPPPAGINLAMAGSSEEVAVPSAGSHNAGAGCLLLLRACTVASIQDKDLVVQRQALCTMPLLLSQKIRAHRSLFPALLAAPKRAAPTRFGQEEPQLLFSVQVPRHNSFSRLSPPAQPRRGWMHQSQKAAGKWGELHHCQPHLMCMVFASKQAPVTSQAFPPAADPGNISTSTVGFPWRDRKSLGSVIFLPRS